MAQTVELQKVETRIEPNLFQALEEKRKAADRSVAAEVRQAIRAWVGDEDRESSTSKAAA